MPYLGRCVSCNWACIAELESEIKGVLRKHSEKRHDTNRHTVSQISREEYYFYKKFWDSPLFWRAWNGGTLSEPTPISVEGAEAGSQGRFLRAPTKGEENVWTKNRLRLR